MHLLAAQAGAIQQDGEAIDLAQSPGEVVFATSADSELAMLAAAADRAGYKDLRLANLLRLSHNLSIDMWLDRTVRYARLIVLRLIGGPAYWQYGVDEMTALAQAHDIPLVLLSHDAVPDPVLRERSTIRPDDWDRLLSLFVAGGPENADTLLAAFKALAATRRLDDITTQPFSRFGFWHPALGMTDAEQLRATHAIGISPLAGEVGRGVTPSRSPSASPPAYIPLLFYRAALEGAGTATLEALIAALEARGLAPVPLVVSTLKEPSCARFVASAFEAFPPDVILNLTGFALGLDGLDPQANPFAATDAPVVQLVQAGRAEAQWRDDWQGLSAKDLAMLVVLPELDGRIGGLIVGHKQADVWHDATECALASYAPDTSGIARAAELAANWSRLRRTANADKRVGLVLANYPLRDGRLANGVGYDAPQSTVEILKVLEKEGYGLAEIPDAAGLIAQLQAGPTNANPHRGTGIVFPLARYRQLLAEFPAGLAEAVTERWGEIESDPFVRGAAFHLPALSFGNIVIVLQPARAYEGEEAANYHDPLLVPPHAYVAAYLWLRHEFGAHALIHNGKHGTLEWLPGKAVALDAASWPDALWGRLPHLYPFIVNDPGEGSQAKRRAGAVIVDHLVPPLTRAETYGPLKDLEALLDEYYAALGMDRRRLAELRRRILDFTRDARLDRDVPLPDDEAEALKTIDNFLCELKEAQIRDGLHVFGRSPAGQMLTDLTVALVRAPRGEEAGAASLIRALTDDLKLGFDPLTAKPGDAWTGPNPIDNPLIVAGKLRRVGDVVELLEGIATKLVEGAECPAEWGATRAVLATVEAVVKPRLAASGPNEIASLLDGLSGKFVAPGPSGAPSRGRLDTLPTGRNFYSVDNRAVPTPAAWELGRKSAENLLLRHFQDHGNPLKALALSVWATANMRTGGDDIAQAMALIGARPQWDPASLRLAGYEIIPLAKLGRPRVDVTLRISGLFRDSFPMQIALFDRAVRAIGALDEPEEENPIAHRMRAEALGLMAEGLSQDEAALRAGHRIFGSKPGTYGAGLNALIDSGNWQTKADLADAAIGFGQYAFGAATNGMPARAPFEKRLSSIEAVVHNQDNREHDLLDSDDYYQFEGGLAAAAEALSGVRPAAYHVDHSRPENPVARTLEEEISRVMRSRVVNPKWIRGMRRHGYKGAFEIIATVDFMFAFAATTGAVKTHHFDLAFEAYVENADVREFLKENNRFGYDELIAKFAEARQRGFWTPRSNSAYALLEETLP